MENETLLSTIKEKLSKKMLVAVVAIALISTIETEAIYKIIAIVIISLTSIVSQGILDFVSIRKTGSPTNGEPKDGK